MAAAKLNFVSEITPAKESWDVVTRVIQLWFVPDMNAKQKHYAMEMVLMDETFIRVSLLLQCFILDFN